MRGSGLVCGGAVIRHWCEDVLQAAVMVLPNASEWTCKWCNQIPSRFIGGESAQTDAEADEHYMMQIRKSMVNFWF